MRKEKSINNIKYNLIFFIFNSILSFALKTMFINNLGSDYTGLNAVLRNLIGFMSVAELGIGTAITYSLYKPLRNKEYENINSILSIYKYVYSIIAIVIGIISLILSFFIGNIVKSEVIMLKDIVLYFFIYVSMTITSYLITYTQIIVIADQKNYIITKITGIINIVKILNQLLIIYFFKSYLIWIISEVIYTMFTYVYINMKISKLYPWIDLNNKKDKKQLFRENKNIFIDTKNIFLHKIGGIVVFQTDNIVLASFTNLLTVTKYTNYLMITSIVNGVIQQVLNGVKASVGDLVAEDNNRKSFLIWSELYTAINTIAIILCYCIYININPLITVWLGEEFLLNNMVVLAICINLFIQMIRGPIDIFKDGYGIFWDRYAPLVEAGVNLVISIYLVQRIGVIGVVIGTLISNIIIIIIWKPYVVFKYGFKVNLIKYLSIIVRNLIISIIAIVITTVLINKVNIICNDLFLQFIIDSGISMIIISITYFSISLIDINHRKVYKKIIQMIKNKSKKHN